jgi:hypothetical protein
MPGELKPPRGTNAKAGAATSEIDATKIIAVTINAFDIFINPSTS